MKTFFTINVDHSIDLITNSSSELFVLEGQNIDMVKEMLSSIYPNYRDEYAEVKNISELSTEELDNYFSYHCKSYQWPAKKSMYPILPGFTFDELYEPKKDYRTGKPEGPAWNGEIQYELKDNTKRKKNAEWHFGSFVTEENKEELLNKLCPKRNLYFLYSLDENPDYDKQEKLEQIATRYHLG